MLSRSLLLGGSVLFWFRDFFSTEDVVPSKLCWVHMCPPFSYRKGLSATATLAAVLLLLCWQTTCEMGSVLLTESIKMNVNNNYLYSTGFSSAIPNLT